jgi:thiamine biosynthesis lipoprotein ApbE
VDADGRGLPAYHWSVTVIAPTAVQADGLATTCYLLDPEAAVALIDRTRGAACLIQGRDGLEVCSRRWPETSAAR